MRIRGDMRTMREKLSRTKELMREVRKSRAQDE